MKNDAELNKKLLCKVKKNNICQSYFWLPKTPLFYIYRTKKTLPKHFPVIACMYYNIQVRSRKENPHKKYNNIFFSNFHFSSKKNYSHSISSRRQDQ